MSEPSKVSSINKCSDTPEYQNYYLGQLADKVLANADAKYFLDQAKRGGTFITINELLLLANVKIPKNLRKKFEAVLLRKIKDPKMRSTLKPKLYKLTKADRIVFSASNIEMASEIQARKQAIGKVLDLAKRGKTALLLRIVKERLRILDDEGKLNANHAGAIKFSILKHIADYKSDTKLLACLVAIHQLGKLKYRKAAACLVKIVKKEHDSRLRRAAIISLGKIGNKRATPALLSVADPDYLNWDRINGVVRRLGGMTANSQMAATLMALQAAPKKRNESITTRKLAIIALGRIADKRAIKPLMKTASQEGSALAPIALTVLSQIPEVIIDHQAAFKEMLVKLMRNKEVQLRNSAAMILATLGDRRAVPVLIKMLAQTNFNNVDLDPSKNISRLIKADPSLGSGKSEAPIFFQHIYNNFLTRYTKDKIPLVKVAVIQKLIELKDKRSILPLIILSKREPKMRKLVIVALSRIINKNSLPSMLALLKHGDRVVRHFAVFFLGYIKDDAVVIPLSKTLYDPDPKVEREAISALRHLSNLPTVRKDYFVHLFIKKYKDQKTDYIARLMILKSLKMFGSKTALALLSTVLKSRDQKLRKVAAEAIRAIKAKSEIKVAVQN